MSYKIILPYVVTTAAAMFGNHAGDATNNTVTDNGNNIKKIELFTDSMRIAERDTIHAQDLFVDAAVETQLSRMMDSIMNAQMIPVNVEQNGKSVIYVYTDGRRVVRNGGTRAWRNNNPGNLRYYDFAKNNGAIGEAGKFAVFPDEQTGMRALYNLLQTNSYRNLTIAQALKRYNQSNWHAYTRKLTRLTGLSANVKLSSLNQTQLDAVVQSIRQLEGWIPGNEHQIAAPQYAMAHTAQQRVR